MKKTYIFLSASILLLGFLTGLAYGYTREEVVERGYLQCGVSTGTPGFSSVDGKGNWTGLDVDICRAVAAAVLGDGERVEFLPLAENEAFTALLTGEVDILSRHARWSFSRDSGLAVNFAGISYYDGQGFLVARKLKVERARDLNKVRVCSPVGLSTREELIDYLTRNKVEYKEVPYDTLDLAVKGFDNESCDLLSLHQSQLLGLRLGLSNPDSAVVLPDVISKEPLGPVVRQGDDIWLDIVRWSLFAMVQAEELGISSRNLDEMRISNRLAVRHFFGLENIGSATIGLDVDWAVRIIAQVGNYGEVFTRNFGPQSSLQVERGLNKLWTDGGLQYAPPIR